MLIKVRYPNIVTVMIIPLFKPDELFMSLRSEKNKRKLRKKNFVILKVFEEITIQECCVTTDHVCKKKKKTSQ